MLSMLLAWLPVAAKILFTVAIVVVASFATERSGPFIGALFVTLPVTFWPAYLFVSLDHDRVFVADSATAGMAMHGVSAILVVVYVKLARRWSLLPSLAAAIAVWLGLGIVARSLAWNFWSAALFDVVAYAAALALVRDDRHAVMPAIKRQWYDLPVRVVMICVLMGTILAMSAWAGPVVTGFTAVFPVALVSTILVLHRRIGGAATAAMAANGIRGMVGIAIALAALQLCVVPFGPAVALAFLLVIPIAWNLTTFLMRRPPVPARAR
jgi:hypothetical protein